MSPVSRADVPAIGMGATVMGLPFPGTLSAERPIADNGIGNERFWGGNTHGLYICGTAICRLPSSSKTDADMAM